MTNLFDNRRFAELMAHSHIDAAQYCVDCGIDTEINGISVYEMVKAPKEVVEVVKNKEVETVKVEETEEAPLLTKEELQELLKNNNIKFSHLTGEVKLLQLAQENGLL